MNVGLVHYFEGAVGQLLERTRHLRGMVPRPPKPEFRTLAVACNEALDLAVEKLEALHDPTVWGNNRAQAVRLREYRRVVHEIDVVENAVVAALTRNHNDDLFLNQLIGKIAEDVSYPLVPPVVSCLSQGYYRIYPQYNLLCVPLAESRFLLQLPDLYHELGHAVLSDQNHPASAEYNQALNRALFEVQGYLARQQQAEQLARGPASFARNLDLWESCWLEAWLSEFFCDLFALYALGPAFAWSHFHLCAQRGHDPFAVPPIGDDSHPCDEARTSVMLYGLGILGYPEEATKIRLHWDSLTSILPSPHQPEYCRCFPDHLLLKIAQEAFDGYRAMGCAYASEERPSILRSKFTEAWNRFWMEPKTYAFWESSAVRALKNHCAT